MTWYSIATAPKDKRAVLLLSAGDNFDWGRELGGIQRRPPVLAIGHWDPEGDAWVDEYGSLEGDACRLAITGVWLSGGGWFEPNEVTHWQPLPLPPEDMMKKTELVTTTNCDTCGDTCCGICTLCRRDVCERHSDSHYFGSSQLIFRLCDQCRSTEYFEDFVKKADDLFDAYREGCFILLAQWRNLAATKKETS